MRKFIFAILTLLTISTTSTAFAGLHIEPWLGYETGKFENVMIANGTPAPMEEDDLSSMNYGLRLGYSMLLFSAGVEYTAGSGTIDGDTDTDFNTTDMGVFVGVDFPILVRAYATYFFSAKANAKNSTDGIDADLEGKGYKIGVGFTGLPFVSLNLEAMFREYDKENLFTTPFLIDIEPKSASYLLTVSFPFDI